MSNYINPDTTFSAVTITNDNVCLNGGSWTAKLQDGKTVYVSDSDPTKVYDGPVNLLSGTLTIESGAVVDDLVALQTQTQFSTNGSQPVINIESGGVLQNSTVFNSTVTVETGGTSQNNAYVSNTFSMQDNSLSSGDYFYQPGKLANTSGTLNLSQLPSQTHFLTSNGTSTYSVRNSTSVGIVFNDPHFPNITANNPNTPQATTQSIALAHNYKFGNIALDNPTANATYSTSGAFLR